MNRPPVFALAACLVGSPFALGQITQTWNTDTPASAWSAAGNWNPAGNPAGNDLVFGDAFGRTASATTVGNIVDQNFTLNSLTYNNTGATGSVWQVTQIASGVTLTLDSALATPPASIFTVGGVSGQSSRVALTGGGSLVINEASSAINIGAPATSTPNTSVVLDMSGLAAFSATVDTINFGGPTSRATADVTLAGTNTLTAKTLNVGVNTGSSWGGTKSDLLLGASNVLNIDTINVGQNLGSGTIAFRAGLTDPTVTIRGSAGGSSRANLTIADTGSSAIGNGQGSSVNFGGNGGSVDALIDQLLIGRRADAGTGTGYTGSLSMAKGSIDANTTVVGQSAGAGNASGSFTASLSVSGGAFSTGSLTLADNTAGATSVTSTFTVSGSGSATVRGHLITGSRTGTASTVAANVVISGGTLLIQGDLKEGSGGADVTSSVALSGGMLNMDHGAIAVDTFTFTGGTLRDVAAFSATASGGLNVQNAATLAFTLDGSFTTLNLTGALTLGGASNLALTLANGYAPAASFTLVANDQLDAVTGSFATINGLAFGPGQSFFLSNDQGTFEYTLTYTGGDGNDVLITAVPEPTATALLLLAGATITLRTLHRRSPRQG